MKQEENIVIIKEGIIGSIITDFVSFGVLAAMLWINFAYLGNQWLITLFILTIWFLEMMMRSKDLHNLHRFKSVDEALLFLNELKGDKKNG